jgi:hypothetical protein
VLDISDAEGQAIFGEIPARLPCAEAGVAG